MVPEWLLVPGVSGNAVKLYALLARYTNEAGHAWPSRQTLATRMGLSVKTVDRTVQELVSAQAVAVSARVDAAGDRTSNLYVVALTEPSTQVGTQVSPPRDASVATGRDAGVATVGTQVSHEREPDEREPVEEEPTVVAAAPTRLDVERLCDLLADRIEANGSKRPTITKAWRDSARLLMDRDERTEENITRAIEWCQADEFWRGNVLSMPTLRKQYDRLRHASMRPKAGARRNDIDWDAALARAKAQDALNEPNRTDAAGSTVTAGYREVPVGQVAASVRHHRNDLQEAQVS